MPEQHCKTKYVFLEMILSRGDKYDVISGLFKGIVKEGEQTFIALHGLNSSTNFLNLSFYNIMTIEHLSDDLKSMVYLENTEADKKIAHDMVHNLFEQMQTAGMCVVNDDRIIDLAEYKEVPKEFLEGKEIDRGVIGNTGSGTYKAPGNTFNNMYKKHVPGDTTKSVVKVDPVPTILTRTKSKKSTKRALQIMQEKLDQILEGSFKCDLPEIVENPDTDTSVVETVGKSAAIGRIGFEDDDGSTLGGWAGCC